MKKLIATALTAAMLLLGASSVFAAETVPAAEGLTLADGSHLVLDSEKGYVDKIDGTITVAELKANFALAVTVTSANGETKADDAAVATDDVVAAGESTLKALIYGDVNRDGKAGLADVSGILRRIAGWEIDINPYAADVDKNNRINLFDASKILKAIAGWDDISLGNVRMVFENKKVTAENEDETLQLFFTSVMNKLGRSETDNTGEHSYKIKLAKNESESCQALMVSGEYKEGLTAELTDFVYEYGDATLESGLEWVNYYPNSAVLTQVLPWDANNQQIKTDDHPEVLLPMADSFELSENRLQHMMITVTSAKDSPAGMYKAQLHIKGADGTVIKTADVYAYVWDFALPDAPYSASLFNTSYYFSSSSASEAYTAYYEHMLDMNLSGYMLPYDITDERADAYMSDPRVTSFVIAGTHEYYGGVMAKTDEYTFASYTKVASNPEWAKKGLFYYTDEPYGTGLQEVKTTYEYVTALLGTTNIRNITPLAANNTFVDTEAETAGIDPVAYIDPYINVWCPRSDAFHLFAEGGSWTPKRFLNKYGEFADRARAFKEKGEEVWWYLGIFSAAPYANYFTTYQGVINRLFSWQQYFNDVDGVLYWATGNGWPTISKYQFDIGNGDGTLQYPGEFWGFEGPQASWRLLQIRDGFDDFDYLRMAEEIVGREKVMEVVKKVSDGMLNYTEDYRVLEAARDEIVDMIVEAKS